MQDLYDIVIVGSGPAGMSAAMYSARAGYRTLLVENVGPGGQIMLTDVIDNYPGFPDGITGFELQEKMYKQLSKFGSEYMTANVTSIEKSEPYFVVNTDKTSIKSISVIIATGAKHRHINVPGEKELASRGVSYCGTCDGPFYRNKKVVIIGGGDTALTEALFIAKFAASIDIIHRKDRFRAVSSLVEKVGSLNNVNFIFDSVINSINGTDKVTSVTISNLKDNSTRQIDADGVFVFIGLDPNTSFVDTSILDESRYIITDEKMETKIAGLYAAGDVRSNTFRQVVCAASDGAKAAFYAGEYVDNMKGKTYK